MTITKITLNDVAEYMEQEGLDSYGEAGFGEEYVAALKKLGVTDGDEIELFPTSPMGFISEENGSGRINGRLFGEDGNCCELALYWLDEFYGEEAV